MIPKNCALIFWCYVVNTSVVWHELIITLVADGYFHLDDDGDDDDNFDY